MPILLSINAFLMFMIIIKLERNIHYMLEAEDDDWTYNR